MVALIYKVFEIPLQNLFESMARLMDVGLVKERIFMDTPTVLPV